MRVYWLVAFITFIIQFSPVKGDKQYWWRTVISFIPLFLFMALRKDYGIDETVYHDYFDAVHMATDIFSVNSHMEPGYAILNKIMPSYQLLIVFQSFLTCWAYSFLLYRFVPQKYSWLAILLLFMNPNVTILFMISGIRNGMAASILILSCYYIEKRRLISFIILGAIAMSIHTSALLMFTLCYILGANTPITRHETFVWIGFVLFAATASLAAIANGLLPVIEMFMGRYTEEVQSMAEIADGRGFKAALLGIAYTTGFLFYNRTELNKLSADSQVYEQNTIMKYKLALIYAASFTIGTLSGRMTRYMIYYFIVAIVCIFAFSKNTIFKYGFLSVVLYYYWITYNDWLIDFYFHYDVYTSILGDF